MNQPLNQQIRICLEVFQISWGESGPLLSLSWPRIQSEVVAVEQKGLPTHTLPASPPVPIWFNKYKSGAFAIFPFLLLPLILPP